MVVERLSLVSKRMNDDALTNDASALSGVGDGITHGEQPNDSDEIQTKPASRKGGIGVQFKSQRSIEEVTYIRRLSNFSDEEITSYWGEHDDRVLRKKELTKAVRDLHYYQRTSDKDFTRLGLDQLAGRGKAIKKSNRKKSRYVVLDEQELQHHEGVYDDELMAGVYSHSSEAAKTAAQKKAKKLHNTLIDYEK
mmetsp:Transcript_4946/g.10978  ORF Transcript_4946/g.10978 Transcript_4946/m.10978 type:complete len:194 (+) Transcript_4946:84-665(+)